MLDTETQTPYNDIVEARKAIFEHIQCVASGEYSLEKGIVLHKMYGHLMEGYRIQAKVYEVATLSQHTPTTLTAITAELK